VSDKQIIRAAVRDELAPRRRERLQSEQVILRSLERTQMRVTPWRKDEHGMTRKIFAVDESD
jgi:hypothetical protein